MDFCSNSASAILFLINPVTQTGYQEPLEGLSEVDIDFAGVVDIEAVIAVNFAVREDEARGDAEEADDTMPNGQVSVVFFVFAVNVEEIFTFGVAFAVAPHQAGGDAFAPFLSPAETGIEAVISIARAACAFVTEVKPGEPVLFLVW